jgi:IclR family pca regulon transcriptional regulator
MTAVERGEYVQSLDRGLAVIRCFNEDRQRLTIADIARETGLTRATARRFLHTLEHLGYVGSVDGRFFLRPRVLQLGFAYLSSVSVPEIAQQHLLLLAEKLHESCSASVLDGDDIVYVARAQTKRIMTIALAVGSRLPAHVTSMGRVLIAAMPAAQREEYLANFELRGLTEHTITNRRKLRAALNEVAAHGYCLIDQELEVGVRSVAAPVHDSTGQVVAAVNASGHASRVSMERLHDEFLPLLLQTAADIDTDLALRR